MKKNKAILLLVIALTASIGLNAYQFVVSRHYYAEMLSVRLDPLGEKEVRPVRHEVSEDGFALLILGDSRAFSWPRPEMVTKWRFRNMGVNSQTTAQILGRIQKDPASVTADVVLFQAGINDLKAIGLHPERKDEIVSGCKSNIASIADFCVEQSDVLILTTIFPTGTPSLARRTIWSSEIAVAVEEVNDYIATLATDRILVLDAADLLRAQNGKLDPEFTKNALHPNKAGYEILNRELTRILEIRKRRSRQCLTVGEPTA